MVYIYMLTFTINIPQMWAYIPYMDPMGMVKQFGRCWIPLFFDWVSTCWKPSGAGFRKHRPRLLCQNKLNFNMSFFATHNKNLPDRFQWSILIGFIFTEMEVQQVSKRHHTHTLLRTVVDCLIGRQLFSAIELWEITMFHLWIAEQLRGALEIHGFKLT